MSDDPYLQLGKVGPCEILSYLGSGATAAVYKGRHETLKIDVAIKFLLPHIARKPDMVERFLNEAQLAARLNHPGIVRVYDCGALHGHSYLVMEYVPGQTLGDVLEAEGHLTVARVLELAAGVAEALLEAQSQVGVIHRDIKPDNILFGSNNKIKLADLGLAKVLAADPALSAPGKTIPGQAMGTPRYMSPEQFASASEVDHRADIFSLGATLYHALTGQPPFLGENFVEVMKQVEQAEPAPLPAGITLEVEELIFRMMAKQAKDRFQTYDDLLRGIAAAQASLENGGVHVARTMDSSSMQGTIPAVKSGSVLRPATPTEKRVLLVVDVQNDFCPYGALSVPEGDEVVPIINKLSRRFAHVILTQDWHCEDHLSFASSHPGTQPLSTVQLSYGAQILWPDHCVQGTLGAQFHPDLEVQHCEMVIRKGYHRDIDSYSAFFENDRQTPTGLAGYLRERGLSQLFIVGLATDFCVAYSALDARRLGFEVTVIENACRGIDVEGSLEAAWRQMEQAGVVRA